jgi:hypothetical protein
MRFCDFLKKLYERFPCSSQDRFVLEVFSALCGETEPIKSNNDNAYHSDTLPDGLTGIDGTYRKRLFGGNKKYNGLSAPIKGHILEHKNVDTFIAYCAASVSETEFSALAADFGVSDVTDRFAVFYGLYCQFLEFSNSPNDDVLCVVSNGIAEYKKGTTGVEVPQLSPLHPGDDFTIGGNPNPRVKHGFYTKFSFAWSVTNIGLIIWNGRVLEPAQISPLKTSTPKVDIPTLNPGEKVSLKVELDTRGDERGSPYEISWEIRDSNGRACFPNKEPLRLTVEVVNKRKNELEVK